ncbi:C2 family cysteine protease [Actinomyces wuliandei]|uniref:C2 family cysteine protease n=1 Tax=Actinomyces wuliandei TaxID=2057743 RepID=UPI000FDBCAC6|nr:C2 family cysteine protease [Actinomyces wuliandei]
MRELREIRVGLRAQAESLVGSALGNPLAAGPAAAGLASLAATYQALRAEVSHAATQAATTLGTATVDTDDSDINKWTTFELRDSDIERIRQQADGTAEWDSVEQENIGDCYLLAVLQAYSDTEEGRQALRDQVRWDEAQNAFVVTFHDGDQEVEITVDDFYLFGNQGTDKGFPSIINIYERAYALYLEQQGRDPEDVEGGDPTDPMEALSGEGTQTVSTDGWGWGRWGFLPYPRHYNQHEYTDAEWDTIKEAVEEGRVVVGGTARGDFSDGSTVQATVDTNGNGRIDTGDQEGGFQVWDSHAYTVVDIDDEYVTLYNPWDTNPVSKDDDVEGGTIRITREDYEKYFNKTYIGDM